MYWVCPYSNRADVLELADKTNDCVDLVAEDNFLATDSDTTDVKADLSRYNDCG